MPYYVVVPRGDGRGIKAINGPYPSEREADNAAEDSGSLDCETFFFNTVQLSEATRKIKHIFFRRTKDLDGATQRVGHKVA